MKKGKTARGTILVQVTQPKHLRRGEAHQPDGNLLQVLVRWQGLGEARGNRHKIHMKREK